MANYIASCRTNRFRVKDPEAFKTAMASIHDVEVEGDDGVFLLIGSNDDGAGWPCSQYDEDKDEDVELDFFALVAPHLEDGEVAIFMEVGAEKLRYLIGYAIAVNNKGEKLVVALDDIYKLAEKLAPGKEITKVQY